MLPSSSAPADQRLDVQGYLFDLDGVLWLADQAIPGVKETLDELRRRGKRVMFVSNTSSRSRQQCLLQFQEMGLDIAGDELFIAGEATAQYLAEQKPGARAYVIGSGGLLDELRRAGIDARPADTRTPEAADFVVVGKDSDLTFTKLTCALRALRAGAQLVAVNCDMTVPAADGLEPGAGAIVAAVSAMIGRDPDITVGKPSTFLLERAIAHAGLTPNQCAMVGDTLEADIAAGNRLGMKTILVLTGNTTERDLADADQLPPEWRPDVVLESVNDLVAEAVPHGQE